MANPLDALDGQEGIIIYLNKEQDVFESRVTIKDSNAAVNILEIFLNVVLAAAIENKDEDVEAMCKNALLSADLDITEANEVIVVGLQ